MITFNIWRSLCLQRTRRKLCSVGSKGNAKRNTCARARAEQPELWSLLISCFCSKDKIHGFSGICLKSSYKIHQLWATYSMWIQRSLADSLIFTFHIKASRTYTGTGWWYPHQRESHWGLRKCVFMQIWEPSSTYSTTVNLQKEKDSVHLWSQSVTGRKLDPRSKQKKRQGVSKNSCFKKVWESPLVSPLIHVSHLSLLRRLWTGAQLWIVARPSCSLIH